MTLAAGLIRIEIGQLRSSSEKEALRYVGIQTDIRKSAVFLLAGWRDFACGLYVPQSLALADHLFWCGFNMPGCRIGRITQEA